MDADRFRRIDDVFSALVDLPPARRDARMRELCGQDDELEAEVLELLAAADRDETIGVIVDAAQGDVAVQIPAGSRVDVYTIGRLLGRGGMGEVYGAEQTEPVTRTVAFKVVHSHLASATIVRRFEAERQTLAMMDHDSIAKMFDAGTTAGGRPYFVMELVNGVPVDRYAADA